MMPPMLIPDRLSPRGFRREDYRRQLARACRKGFRKVNIER
jgi:hypothetical protein